MKKFIVSIYFCAAVFVFSTVEAFACSCVVPPPVEEVFGNYPAIFSGKVISSANVRNSVRKVRIKVSNSWKGKAPKIVTIKTSAAGSMCGYYFTVGKSYLIYADGEAWKNLSVSLCSRTQLLSYAKEDVKALNDLPPETKSAQE